MYRHILNLLLLLPSISLADYGSGAADFFCDKEKGVLRVSTYVLWNEHYDKFIADNPNGQKLSPLSATYTLKQLESDVDFTCNLDKESIQVRLNKAHLEISIEGKTIYKYTDSYPYGESIYGVGSSITEYELNISSDGKIEECISRYSEKAVCGLFTYEK